MNIKLTKDFIKVSETMKSIIITKLLKLTKIERTLERILSKITLYVTVFRAIILKYKRNDFLDIKHVTKISQGCPNILYINFYKSGPKVALGISSKSFDMRMSNTFRNINAFHKATQINIAKICLQKRKPKINEQNSLSDIKKINMDGATGLPLISTISTKIVTPRIKMMTKSFDIKLNG